MIFWALPEASPRNQASIDLGILMRSRSERLPHKRPNVSKSMLAPNSLTYSSYCSRTWAEYHTVIASSAAFLYLPKCLPGYTDGGSRTSIDLPFPQGHSRLRPMQAQFLIGEIASKWMHTGRIKHFLYLLAFDHDLGFSLDAPDSRLLKIRYIQRNNVLTDKTQRCNHGPFS